MNDDGTINDVELANMETVLEFKARLCAVFYEKLKAQSLPEPLIQTLLVAFLNSLNSR
jgi:G:T/U-mismatch repair DNA glycosylase